MKINERIKERLREYNIPMDDGIHYLLGVHFGHVSEHFPEILKKKLLAARVYENDSKANGTLKWNLPLFDDQVTGFEWVSEWMDLFGNLNKDRRGVKSYVMSRMKKFFVENPHVRSEEVMGATKLYMNNVDNVKYLKSSHKFIMEGKGQEKYSQLLEWIQKYREYAKTFEGERSLDRQMK